MTNTTIWDALAKTDPKHTKPFNRAGGFKGTAIKPIWIIRKLTEQFGAAGVGWGVNEPRFEVVTADGEILVYCTVSCWHGDKANVLWGVGGDKVQAKRQGGFFNDDEAFKKAFTDAVGNAFKTIGIGADVHMGLFDDDKYVTAAKAEFDGSKEPDAGLQIMLDQIAKCETQLALKQWWKANEAGVGGHADAVVAAINERKAQVELMDRSAA